MGCGSPPDAAQGARSVEQARTQLQALPAAKREAREAHLKRLFSGNELLRARTLLGLPP